MTQLTSSVRIIAAFLADGAAIMMMTVAMGQMRLTVLHAIAQRVSSSVAMSDVLPPAKYVMARITAVTTLMRYIPRASQR